MFGFLGCPVQIFQRSIMQQCGNNAPVALLNLLDPGLFPYTRVNGSVFPRPDDAIKAPHACRRLAELRPGDHPVCRRRRARHL